MSLATQLLKKVQEAKQAAKDEMSVPKYDNLGTPNNHVDGSSNATKEVSASGLGDRKVKNPTANVGSPGKERRDMEGPKQSAKKMRESIHKDIFMDILEKNPGIDPDEAYEMATSQMADDADNAYDRKRDDQMIGVDRGPIGPTGKPIDEAPGDTMAGAPGSQNRVLQALGLGVSNGLLHWHHPGNPEQTYQVEYTPEVKKAFRSAVASMANRPGDAVEMMWEFLSDLAESGTGYDPRMTAGMGESAHKTAAGEMNKPSVSTGNPAKTAKVRGKQPDEPKNKGNPGTGREEKGQPKQQFTMKPKDYKGGENEHKSMKKMHENIRDLENLLGRKLDLG